MKTTLLLVSRSKFLPLELPVKLFRVITHSLLTAATLSYKKGQDVHTGKHTPFSTEVSGNHH